MNQQRNRQRAFSLVELMIVVAIIGVLSTLAIQGVRRYLANAKSAEAKNAIGSMAKSAVQAFDQERSLSTGVMSAGATAATSKQFCASAAATVPAGIASVKGVKYQPNPTEWSGDSNTGWRCLKFSVDNPIAYMYEYKATVTTGAGDFTASAYGDLNGDGTTSSFRIAGAATTGVARYAPTIAETSPDE
jgi:type IV pilus assembly protein PilA